MTDKRKTPKTDRHYFKQSHFDYDAFGLACKIARVREGATQDDAAYSVGCVRSTISKCERGMAINPRIMLNLCMLYKLNILDYCIS